MLVDIINYLLPPQFVQEADGECIGLVAVVDIGVVPEGLRRELEEF
jgi:hypothetical protein